VIDYLRRTPTLVRLLRSLAGGLARVVIASICVAFLGPDAMTEGEQYILVFVLVAATYAWDIHDELTARRDAK
jgi:hypothetical protein